MASELFRCRSRLREWSTLGAAELVDNYAIGREADHRAVEEDWREPGRLFCIAPISATQKPAAWPKARLAGVRAAKREASLRCAQA